MILEICCDGVVKKGKWGVGLTWKTMKTETKEVVESGEDVLNGYCESSPHIFQSEGDRQDVGIAEALAFIHALYWAWQFQAKYDVVKIVSDRMSTIRTLQNEQVHKILKDTSFYRCLKFLRFQMSCALQMHGCIQFSYMGREGYDSDWRPDTLSRVIENNCDLFNPHRIPDLPTSEYAVSAINGEDKYLSTAHFEDEVWSLSREHLIGVLIIEHDLWRRRRNLG